MFALDAGREVVHRAGVGHVDPEWVNKRCLIGGGFRRREIDVGGYGWPGRGSIPSSLRIIRGQTRSMHAPSARSGRPGT